MDGRTTDSRLSEKLTRTVGSGELQITGIIEKRDDRRQYINITTYL